MGVCPVRKREGKWDREFQVRWCHRQRSKFLEGQRVHVCLVGHAGAQVWGSIRATGHCSLGQGYDRTQGHRALRQESAPRHHDSSQGFVGEGNCFKAHPIPDPSYAPCPPQNRTLLKSMDSCWTQTQTRHCHRLTFGKMLSLPSGPRLAPL